MDGAQASGAFVACGPPGFTAIALINLADHAREMSVLRPPSCRSFLTLISRLPAQNILFPDSGEVWYAASVVCALFLFGLAVFFFVFGALPYWFKFDKHLNEILACKQLPTEGGRELIMLICFMLGWALTFPNGMYKIVSAWFITNDPPLLFQSVGFSHYAKLGTSSIYEHSLFGTPLWSFTCVPLGPFSLVSPLSLSAKGKFSMLPLKTWPGIPKKE